VSSCSPAELRISLEGLALEGEERQHRVRLCMDLAHDGGAPSVGAGRERKWARPREVLRQLAWMSAAEAWRQGAGSGLCAGHGEGFRSCVQPVGKKKYARAKEMLGVRQEGRDCHGPVSMSERRRRWSGCSKESWLRGCKKGDGHAMGLC